MLPTDRWSWSTQDGTKHTPKESFNLPENWEWEDDWYLDPTVPGDEKVLLWLYHDRMGSLSANGFVRDFGSQI